MALDREQYINSVNLNIDTDFPYLFPEIPDFMSCTGMRICNSFWCWTVQ